MATKRRWPDDLFGFKVACNLCFNRAAGLEINMTRPIHGHIRLSRDQFSRHAIQDIKEPIFWRLHDDLPVFTLNF